MNQAEGRLLGPEEEADLDQISKECGKLENLTNAGKEHTGNMEHCEKTKP